VNKVSQGVCGVLVTFVFVVTSLFPYARAHASPLSFISDLISTSAPSIPASHTVQFIVTHAVPAGGSITITPQDSFFIVPFGFDYTDVDFAVSNGIGGYVDRDVAASADATNDGVAATVGTSGSITLTLNSTTGLNAGDHVRVTLGTLASYGATGSVSLVNPSLTTSYRIHIATYDASLAPIDSSDTMIAVVAPITLSGAISLVRPILSNGLPSGLIAANNTTIELSLQTFDLATCRYATSSGVDYFLMPGHFSQTLANLSSVILTGFQNDTTYTFYVRCINALGNTNDDDFLITFNLDKTPISNTSLDSNGNPTTGPGGYLGPGGTGDVPDGSSLLYLATVSFSGFAIPLSTVTVLKDGVVSATTQSHADGTFKMTLLGLERGAYTFQLFDRDNAGVTSASYPSTLTLGSGTTNDISDIVISPTIALDSDTVAVGEKAHVSGATIPNARVEIAVGLQTSATTSSQTYAYTATSSVTGAWDTTIETANLKSGIYVVSARAIESAQEKSDFGKPAFLGVGGSPTHTPGNADLNHDGKVNLIDFSIMLSQWGTAGTTADLNGDGTVNLADFSILLFNWTG
jgi:hypothetical protein